MRERVHIQIGRLQYEKYEQANYASSTDRIFVHCFARGVEVSHSTPGPIQLLAKDRASGNAGKGVFGNIVGSLQSVDSNRFYS